jgi:hypothetical protein
VRTSRCGLLLSTGALSFGSSRKAEILECFTSVVQRIVRRIEIATEANVYSLNAITLIEAALLGEGSDHCEAEFHASAIALLRILSLAFVKQQCRDYSTPRRCVVRQPCEAIAPLPVRLATGRTHKGIPSCTEHWNLQHSRAGEHVPMLLRSLCFLPALRRTRHRNCCRPSPNPKEPPTQKSIPTFEPRNRPLNCRNIAISLIIGSMSAIAWFRHLTLYPMYHVVGPS